MAFKNSNLNHSDDEKKFKSLSFFFIFLSKYTDYAQR